ncbi:MAG: ABC transporter permease, partial [Bacilli bacterium]
VDNSLLLKKVYIPKYIFPIEKVMFAFVNALFSLIAVVIVLLILKVPVSWTILLFPIPLIYTLIFSAGLGLILSTLNVFFRDTEHLYGVFVTAWMYLTPIIYPMEMLPNIMQKLMKFNPLYHYVEYFRQVVLYGMIPDLKENLICICCSLLFFIVGLLFFKNKQDKFILFI